MRAREMDLEHPEELKLEQEPPRETAQATDTPAVAKL